MLEKEKIELAIEQMNRAIEIIGFIPSYIDLGDYNGAVNRAYYAVFHAIKAIEQLDGFDSKKHSGLIAHFRQNYIKTGIIDIEYSAVIQELSQMRNDSDYNILAIITSEDASEQYNNAKEFVGVVKKHLELRINKN